MCNIKNLRCDKNKTERKESGQKYNHASKREGYFGKRTTQTQNVTTSDDKCSKEAHISQPRIATTPAQSFETQLQVSHAPTHAAHPKPNIQENHPQSPMNRTQPRSKKKARTIKTRNW